MSVENIDNKKQARQLAEEHWDWLESILFQQRLMEKKLFIDAAIHFFKHGVEWAERKVDENR